MALLNPPDAVPEAMRFLVRALLAHPKSTCSRDHLIGLVAPDGLIEAMTSIGAGADVEDAPDGDNVKTGGQTIADRSLDALTRLAFTQVDGPLVSATSAATERWRRPGDVTAMSFAAAMREALFAVADPTNAGPDAGVMDLIGGLALLVNAPDPLVVFDGFDQRGANRRFVEHQQRHFGEQRSAWPIGNKERWLAFRRFAVYLGLAQPVGSTGILSDASSGLRAGLNELPAGRLDASDFVARCAQAVPVFDGGPLHLVDDDRDAAELSPGLSLSLRQLEADGTIRLDREGDAPSRVLAIGSASGFRKEVTYVMWLGARQAA